MSNDNKNKEDQIIDNHEYDGIKEYNNPLPNWWLVTFYGTILFSIIYYAYYQLGSGPNLAEELAADMKIVHERQAAADAAKPQQTEADLQGLVGDATAIKLGGEIFAAKCTSCHGTKAEGIIGPNLTDDHWIHGNGSIADITNVITVGVIDKGMIPWKGQIPDQDIPKVAAYIISLKGSNPPNAKAPEGVEYK